MEKRMIKKLLALLIVITIVATDFFVLGSSLIAYAASQIETETNEPNIEFSAYFKDDTGNETDVIEKSITTENLKLYAKVNIKNEGYLNGTIEIKNSDFNLKNDILSPHVANIEGNKVELKQINVEEPVEIELGIEPIFSERVPADMLLETTVVLSGKYISSENENGEELVPAERTVGVRYRVDENIWGMELYPQIITNNKYLVNGTEKRVIQALIRTGVYENQYPTENIDITLNVPQLSGENPEVSVMALGKLASNGLTEISTDDWEVNEGNLQINIKNEKDGNNQINWSKGKNYDELIVTYIYPADVDVSGLDIRVNSKIKLYNYEDICDSGERRCVDLDKTSSNLIIAKPQITTELYKGQLYANATSTEDIEVEYETKTIIGITNTEICDQITVHEDIDTFKTDNGELALDTKYKSTKIIKEKFLELFDANATIEVKNGDDVITPNEIDGNIVINYPTDTNVNEIDIVITGKPIATGVLEIEHVKAITEIKSEDYDRDDIKKVKTLNTKNTILATLEGNNVVENSTETNIELKETTSKAELTIVGDVKKLATGETNELKLGVEFITNGTQYDLYKNPVLYIELPEAVEDVKVSKIDKVYDDNNEFGEASSEVIERNNRKCVKVTLLGEQEAYPNTQLYLQIILTDIILKDLTTSHKDKITMEYTNSNASQYYNNAISTQNIGISGPSKLVTEFDITGNQNVSKKQIQAGENVGFEILLINDTDSNMNDVKILGKLPTEGNSVEGKSANTLVTILKEVIATNSTVYYTENSNATADVNNSENGWTNNLSEVPNAKLYLIEVGDLSKGANYSAGIKVKVANTIEETAESYTNYDIICGTEVIKTSRTIGLVAYQVSDVEVELTAQVGQDTLKNGNTVKEGEVIKYTVTAVNTTGKTLENVEVKANVPEGTVLVVPQEEYEYFFNYYEEVTDETKIAEVTSKVFATLEPSTAYKLEYEVRVKTDITTAGITEISNKAIATCNNVVSESKEIKNTIQASKIRVSIESAVPREVTIFAGSVMEYYVYIENISNETVKNLEMQIISDMFEITKVTSDGINYNEETGIPTEISINKIPAKTSMQIIIKGKIKDNAGDLLQTMAVVTDANGTYRSNLFTDELPHVDATISLTSNKENNSYVEYGDTIKYTISAKNTGNITETVTVLDEIPEHLRVETISINGKTYLQKADKTANTYTSMISNQIFIKEILEAGETLKIDVETTIIYVPSEDKDEVITNKAEVKANDVTKGISEEITHILTADIDAKEPINPDNPINPDDPIDPEQPTNKNTISGIAWLDTNKNGQKDAGEKLLSNIKVRVYDVSTQNYLFDNNGNIVETKTDNNGKYKIENLEKGSYILLFEYDTNSYEPTTYMADSVKESENSKVVLKKVDVNGKEITTAVTDTINVQEDVSNINIGLKEKLKFDLELSKYISKVVVQTNKDTKAYDYEDTTFTKVEIHKKQVQGALVVLEYTIKVKNTGELAGYVKNIVDYLPSGLTFSSELNKDWYLSDNNLYTKSLESVELQPGEEKEVKLILTKTMTAENLGLINNRAEIYQDYNQYGELDIDSTPNNQVQDEDDLGAVDVIILVSTGGSTISYLILLMINIVLIGIAINLMIKSRIIVIPHKKERR